MVSKKKNNLRHPIQAKLKYIFTISAVEPGEQNENFSIPLKKYT